MLPHVKLAPGPIGASVGAKPPAAAHPCPLGEVGAAQVARWVAGSPAATRRAGDAPRARKLDREQLLGVVVLVDVKRMDALKRENFALPLFFKTTNSNPLAFV